MRPIMSLVLVALFCCWQSINSPLVAITSNPVSSLSEPFSPLPVTVEIDRLPRLGETAQVSCIIDSALQQATSTAAELILPDNVEVVSGQTAWEGTIEQRGVASFAVTVRAINEGDTKISCRSDAQLDASNSVGDFDSIYFSVGKDETLVGYMPRSAEELVELAGMILPPEGTLIPETDTSWQWDSMSGDVLSIGPQPPSPEGAEQAPVAETRGGDLTVTGTWNFFDRDDNLTRIKEQEVHHLQRWQTGADLATCRTSTNGIFSCGPFPNPGSDGVRAMVGTRTQYNGPDLLMVRHADFSGTAFNVSLRAQTAIVVFANGTHDIGAWQVNNGSGFEPAYWAQRDYVDAYRYVYFNGGPGDSNSVGGTSGPAMTDWKPDSTNGAYYSGGVIYLEGDDPVSDTVVIHEYGHAVMDTAYSSYPSTPNCSPHFIQSISSTGCAWSEGWASFLKTAVTGDPTYNFKSGSSVNYESSTWTSFGWDEGDQVEGRVTAAMWDMFDTVDDGDDQYGDGDFAPFWNVFYNQDDSYFYWFWAAWKGSTYNYDNSSAGPIMSIYQNAINYRTGSANEQNPDNSSPGNDDFANAATVGSLPFIVSDLDIDDATTQGNDPVHPCGSSIYPKQSRSVWYRYVPSQTGLFEIDTYGSTYDTVLSVWQGTWGSLTNLGCNDDDFSRSGDSSIDKEATGREPAIPQSKVEVAMFSGSTYYIEVSHYSNDSDDTGDLMDLRVVFRSPTMVGLNSAEIHATNPLAIVLFSVLLIVTIGTYTHRKS